jgi:hypothetical protein
MHKTCSPGCSKWITAEVAALPEANATQYFAFSAVATALSKAPLVGFPGLRNRVRTIEMSHDV